MTVAIEQQVLGLQIAVNDVLGVQVIQGQRDLGSVKFGDGIGESLREWWLVGGRVCCEKTDDSSPETCAAN